MARIDLPDGRWVNLRPMWLSEKVAIVAYEEETEGKQTSYLERMTAYAALLRPGITETSWGGDIADMPETTMLNIMARWQTISEDDALPPVTGTSSETPPLPLDSAADR